MRAVMLLCDSAQEVGGKLYILGGGWSIRQGAGQSIMGIAIRLVVGWNEANEPLPIELRLVTQDGDAVQGPQGPVLVNGQIEVGRPPGIPAGTDLDASLAITVAIPLAVGAYRWELDVAGQRLAQESFIVRPGPAQAAAQPGAG